jgi:hypothetical protein
VQDSRLTPDPSLPSVPKAPASAYTLFVKKWFTDNRQSVTADGAKISLKNIAGQMGQAWNDLAEASKDEYTKQAKDLKTTYDKEYKNFLEGLSPESIKAIEAATGKKLRIPGGKKARNQELSRASGSPGKPLTAFFEFMRDFRAKEGGEGEGKEKVTAVAKRAGEKWNSMSEGEKQVSLTGGLGGPKVHLAIRPIDTCSISCH